MTRSTVSRRPSLAFVGDVCLSMDVINTVRKKGVEFLFEGVRPLCQELDFVVGNLESCIIDQGQSEPPLRPPLDTPPDVAEALKTSSINAFSLANNHVMDFGSAGLHSTMKYLEASGLQYFGAGMTLREAEAPLHVQIAGMRLALLGACEFTACWASKHRPGVAPLSKKRLLRRVAEAKEGADIVIVVLHADLEFTRHPAPWRQRLSRRLIEEGAGLVIQHHPHVCQGIERHVGGLIAYSLGNYVFQVNQNEYQAYWPGTADSMLLQVDIELLAGQRTFHPTMHPLSIDLNHRPVPCVSSTAEHRLQNMEELSRQLLDRRVVRAVWRSTCWQQVYGSVFGTYYALRKRGFASAVKHDLDIFRAVESRRWIYGFLSAGFH